MKQISRLPDAELEVMQALWASDTPRPPCPTGRALAQTHPMATTTLLTLLSRLSEKGFVRVDKEGRQEPLRPPGHPGGLSSRPEPQLHPEAVRGQPVHLCLGLM